MPKFTFDCGECGIRFTRTLKMGSHPHHVCPQCSKEAPRLWEGQGFSHAFAPGTPTNSGVSKLDNPSADHVVGASADQRWAEIHEREKVKKQVRKMGGTRALVRKHGHEGGKDFIEYSAGDKSLITARKTLVKKAEAESWGSSKKEAT